MPRRDEAFLDSAVRHWHDAELLMTERRYANADHLVGFAAECAIKAALCDWDEHLHEGKLRKLFHEHINELWGVARVHGNQKRFAKLMAVLKQPNPFDDWTVDQRYARDGAISKETAKRHQEKAKVILAAVEITGKRKRSG